jgi:hypothetical protein
MNIMATAALAALVLLCAPPARALPIDCSATNFKFVDAAYNVDCERWFDAIDIISVTNNDRTIFFTMLERGIMGEPHAYLEYRRLRENITAMFDDEDIKDWKSLDKTAGYELAEFSQDVDGRDSRCIAVQRYSNPMYTGYKRQLIGMGCTTGDLQSVYQILERMDGD